MQTRGIVTVFVEGSLGHRDVSTLLVRTHSHALAPFEAGEIEEGLLPELRWTVLDKLQDRPSGELVRLHLRVKLRLLLLRKVFPASTLVHQIVEPTFMVVLTAKPAARVFRPLTAWADAHGQRLVLLAATPTFARILVLVAVLVLGLLPSFLSLALPGRGDRVFLIGLFFRNKAHVIIIRESFFLFRLLV